MTSHQKDIIKDALGKYTTGAFRLIVLSVLSLLLWQGKNLVNNAIAQSPDVMEAKTTAITAAAAVQQVSNKVDSILSTEARIVEALKQSHADAQATNLSVATLTERVSGVQSQMTRIENKQDAGR